MSVFEIKGFRVDPSRCEIKSTDSCVTVEPKVMDVLKVLYEHRGDVVSQEQIFNQVWPKATFSPSSVQRSIALLRKAFNEDAKQPAFIITHPKRGYSLNIASDSLHQSTASPAYPAMYLVSLVLCVLFGVVWFIAAGVNEPKTSFSTLRPVNSVDANQFNLVLAPDGNKLAFVREVQGKYSIWVKLLSSGKETLVTDKGGRYSNLGWNPQSTALAFVEQQGMAQQLAYISLDPISLVPLNRVDVELFSEFEVVSHNVQWANNHLLYFIEWHQTSNDTQLSTIDLVSKEKQVLYRSKGQDWLKLHALSPQNEQLLALGFEAGQNQYRIDLLNLENGQKQTLATVEDPILGLTWHPSGQHLLISNQYRLLTLDLAGNEEEIGFKNYQYIRDAQYHPDGAEIFMELVNIDVDILASTLGKPEKVRVLVDTSSIDYLPVPSPDGSKFVFESRRYGQKQLFLYQDGQQSLLYANPENEELFGVVWSQRGNQVLTASKDTLYRIDVDTLKVEVIANPHHSFYLRDTFNHSDQILVSYRAENGATLHPAIFNPETLSLTPFQVDGERLDCHGLAIDDQDQVYFSIDDQVYRLNPDASASLVWQSNLNNIIGIQVTGNILYVYHEEQGQYLLSRFNWLDNTTEQVLIGDSNGKMLINSTDDGSQFWFLTEKKRQHSLVHLL